MLQITSKTHLHRPSILNSLSAVDGRLKRIVLIFGSQRTRTEFSVIRRSLTWFVPGNTMRHRHMSKLRFLTVFSAHAVFPLPAPPSALPSLREVAWVHHLLHGDNVRELSVERRRATTSASLPLFPDLSMVFKQTKNVMWEHSCSCTCGPRSQRLASPARSRETKPLGQRHCFVKPSPFHPNVEAATVLAHSFAGIEELTNTRQRTHRKPPLSSGTPSQDPTTFSTSLTSPSRLRSSPLHVHTTVLRTLATPHLQGEFTSWEDAEGLHTETPHIAPHIAPIRGTACPAAYARAENPAAKGCGEARRHLPEMSRSSSDQLA